MVLIILIIGINQSKHDNYCNIIPTPSIIVLLFPLFEASKMSKYQSTAGADPGFSFGGGGGAQKIKCPHKHYERGAKLSFGRGPGPT